MACVIFIGDCFDDGFFTLGCQLDFILRWAGLYFEMIDTGLWYNLKYKLDNLGKCSADSMIFNTGIMIVVLTLGDKD